MILATGAIVGISIILLINPETKINILLRSSFVFLVVAIVIGRLGYVIPQWQYFKNSIPEIIQLSQGGFSFIAAYVGGVFVVIVYSKYADEYWGKLLDLLLPLFTTATIAAWMSCIYVGCGYGILGDSWWAIAALDEWGNINARLPTQLISAFITFLVGYLIIKYQTFGSEGLAASSFFLATFLAFFILTYFLDSPSVVSYGLRSDAWLWLGLIMVSATNLFQLKKRTI